MKSLNPYCPRNQGVTPITNGGTGATTAEDALAKLGAASASTLTGVLTGTNTLSWTIGFAVAGWGLVVPINIGGVDMKINQCRVFSEGRWTNIRLNNTSRMAGTFNAIFDVPENAGIENGKGYLVDFQYQVN